MALVTHGLGQPESGAIVAGGMGATGTDPNALRASLSGTSTLTANLTDGATSAPPVTTTGSPGFQGWVVPVLPQAPQAKPGHVTAHLTGTSLLTAALDFTIDADQLAYELSLALLLDLV